VIFRDGVHRGLESSLVMFLELAERLGDVEFEITSAVRHGDKGSHGDAWAVDIACIDSRMRYRILIALTLAGFRRIGIYDRHIHADRSLSRSDKVIWIGESK